MRTYTLLHASGAVVADLINRTFGIATAPKRTQFNANTKNTSMKESVQNIQPFIRSEKDYQAGSECCAAAPSNSRT